MRCVFLLALVVVVAVVHDAEGAWFRRVARFRIRFRRPFRRIWSRVTGFVKRHVIKPIVKLIKKPVNGGWSGWGPWQISSGCTETCGGGIQENGRERTCNNPEPKNGGRDCPGNDVEFKTVSCNQQACPTVIPPVDGGWTQWDPWSKYNDCTKTCGGGVHSKTRSRSCTNPAPANGGRDCRGRSFFKYTSGCNEQPCPVDGGWSGWGAWSIDSPCTKTCGGGSQDESRLRMCDNPEPKNGGKYCDGDDTEFQTVRCNQQSCPAVIAKVDGKWSRWNPWSDYSSCTKTCGGGSHERTRSRSCTNPKPANGGRSCPGRSSFSQTSPCNEQRCPEDFECPPGKNVYLSGKTCGQYIQCINGVAHMNTCPSGTVWDHKAKTCNHGRC